MIARPAGEPSRQPPFTRLQREPAVDDSAERLLADGDRSFRRTALGPLLDGRQYT